MKENIKPATGRLGVLVVGVGGAVATTMITGTLAARKRNIFSLKLESDFGESEHFISNC